ncbi:MAG TPA: methylated-DNA--[protein]-cysteine S-methyltransferase [Solirubrobacteraceae bacterium]|nr:methylated-DNA--[protein]-cysteine S-methyltransferase [Solirubrobacteraceae bacterium]
MIHTFTTALGVCGLRWSDDGVAAVLMPGAPGLDATAGSGGAPASPEIARAGEAIARLLDGERTDLRFVALDMSGQSEFARDVYEAAREIGAGETGSYGELAAAAGHPGAAREVGAALARNPFPIVVPCHRVLAADGALHGFSAPGGLATKRRMLEIERAPGFEQQPLFA